MRKTSLSPNQARGLIVLSALLWSLSGVFAKTIALSGAVMACYRVLFAGLFLLPWLKGRSVRFKPAMIGMVLCFAAMNVSFVTAMTKTSAANAIFLQYTAPLWMFLASVVILKEPFEKQNLISVLVGLFGIGVILAGGSSDEMSGTILALVAGIAYAGVAIFLRVLRDEDPIWLTTLNLLASGLILVPVLSLEVGGAAQLAVPGPKLAALAGFGIVQMAVPYVLFSRALSSVTTQEAGIITLIEPVANPCLAFLVVGERPALTTIAGGAIILAGVAWRYLRR